MISPVHMLAMLQATGEAGAGPGGGSSGNSVPTSGAPKGVGGTNSSGGALTTSDGSMGNGTNIASRNGRGVTTGVPPTRKGHAGGMGTWCRSECCTFCSGTTPEYWTLTIPGYAPTFRLQRINNSSYGCAWRWTGSETITGCAAATTQITLSVTGVGAHFCLLQVTGGGLQMQWSDTVPANGYNCATSHSLTWLVGGSCTNPGSASIAPGTVRETCCGECGHVGSSGGTSTSSCSNGCCSLKDSTEMYDVDFGAGGLTTHYELDPTTLNYTAAICAQCNTLSGVFTLTRVSDCLWEYTQSFCTTDDYVVALGGSGGVGTCGTNAVTLIITLRRVRSAGTVCRWRVDVSLNETVGAGQSSACGHRSTKAYLGAVEATGTSCSIAPAVNLTEVADETGEVCDGDLPATITLVSA